MSNFYDELEPARDWRDWRYGDAPNHYKYDEKFLFVFLFFGESKSKNYKKAMRVYNSIPERYRIELAAHSVQLFHYSDYLIIRRKFTRLVDLVGRWKSTQIWVNNQLSDPSDLKVFIDIFDSRVRNYRYKHGYDFTLPKIEEE